eukprot:m.70922 g.70922  ORF g.70922 m.70922 type:complete len:181 (+) comp12273_c0_seq5:1461-2003(+)
MYACKSICFDLLCLMHLPSVFTLGLSLTITGTFMAIDTCIQELRNEWRVCDVVRAVARMRQQRGKSVQTASQYCLIYQALEYYTNPANVDSMFGTNQPRDVAMVRDEGESFGFVLRGSYPPFICRVLPGSVAHTNGVKAGDHVLAVNQRETVQCSHKEVVDLVKQAGEVVTLTLRSVAPL